MHIDNKIIFDIFPTFSILKNKSHNFFYHNIKVGLFVEVEGRTHFYISLLVVY